MDAITVSDPLRGSIATTAPLWPARAALATCWARGSSDVTTFSPTGFLPCSWLRMLCRLPVLCAAQFLVAVLLQAGGAKLGVVVADCLGELPTRGVGAFEGAFRAGHAAGQHRAVGGDDRPTVDSLLLEERARVELVVAQRGGFEDGPARGERDSSANSNATRP